MKSRLIALDIDGTILDKRKDLEVPTAVREAIHDARKNGARVCLCSSRPAFFMDDATKDLDEIDAKIGCSGAEIEIDGKIYYRDKISQSVVLGCIKIAIERNVYLSFSGEGVFYSRRKRDDVHAFEEHPAFELMNDDELLEKMKNQSVPCSFIFTEPDEKEDFVTGNPLLAEASTHWSGDNTYTITNKGVDKGTGLLRLAEYWDIPREEILSVGNDENDIPMLKVSGTSVVVGNANPSLFQYADWIAPDVYHAGVAEAIRRYAL